MLSEALLEMFFFSALKTHFQERYGAQHVKLLKPSARREVWVGFDQGWVVSDKSELELFEDIKNVVVGGKKKVERLFVGFFLQFKVVRERTRRSNSTPQGVTRPYFQVTVDMTPSQLTGLSQHETLVLANNIQGGTAAYACPLIFDSDAIYENADLSDLMCVSLDQAPKTWNQGEDHLIVMQSRAEKAVLWCSEPAQGEWEPFADWVDKVEPRSAAEIRKLISTARGVLIDRPGYSDKVAREERAVLPQSLLVAEIRRQVEGGHRV